MKQLDTRGIEGTNLVNAIIFKSIFEQQRIQQLDLGDYGCGIGIKNQDHVLADTKRVRRCKSCGSLTHQRVTHRDCPFNLKNVKAKKERKEQIEKITSDTEEQIGVVKGKDNDESNSESLNEVELISKNLCQFIIKKENDSTHHVD